MLMLIKYKAIHGYVNAAKREHLHMRLGNVAISATSVKTRVLLDEEPNFF
jgi:hypothetical protein